MYKGQDWSPESGDEDFVIESRNCFLTGISAGPPDEFDVFGLSPVRHGVEEAMIQNGADPVKTHILSTFCQQLG